MESTLALFHFDSTDVGDLIVDAESVPTCNDDLERLEEASAEGDLLAVKAALTRIHDGNDANRFRPSWLCHALGKAIQNHHASVVGYLLSQGVPLTPTHVEYTVGAKAMGILPLFVEYGWDINKEMGWSVPPPLALAIEDELLTAWFLSHGADPNAACLLDLTPLSAAVQFAPFPTIKLLFDNGGSIKYGQLLHYAVWREREHHLDVLAYILSKEPPINDVMYQNRLDCYFQRRAFGLGTPLHDAAAKGSLDVVRILVAKDAHPLIRDSLGETPLQRAERNGHSSVIEYLRPITEAASPPLYQFTDGRCAQDGWG